MKKEKGREYDQSYKEAAAAAAARNSLCVSADEFCDQGNSFPHTVSQLRLFFTFISIPLILPHSLF